MKFFSGDMMKNMSTLFLGIVALAALGIYIFDLISGKTIPDVVSMVVTASISVALTAAGFSHGQIVGTSNGLSNSVSNGNPNKNDATQSPINDVPLYEQPTQVHPVPPIQK